MEFSAQQIAGFLNGTIEGDPNVKVSNFSKIEEGKPERIFTAPKERRTQTFLSRILPATA